MTEVAPLLLLACAIIGISILVCLLLLLRRLRPSERNDSVLLLPNQREPAKVPQNAHVVPAQILSPDIEIAVLERNSIRSGEALPSEIGYTLEPILRAIPALANVAASSGGLIRVTFSAEVTRGLADGSLSLMQRVGGFQATAVNSSGQVVGNGVVTLDRAVSSVAVASAVWQILSVVTAQKFLSDINKRLAAIEEGIKRLETWLDSQEQGKFLGSMKYMADISRQKVTALSSDQVVAIKNQLEQIYRDSLQSIAASSIRAEVAIAELVSKNFDGNLKENEAEFRRLIEAYFVPASYAIRFKLSAASSECLAAFAERRPGREIGRLDSIVQGAEDMLQTIKADAEKMRKKATEIKGGFWDSEEKTEAKRTSIRSDIEALAASCEESIRRIRSMRDDAKRISAFAKELESTGLSVVAELDSSGKILRLHSDGTKKGSVA